MTRREIIRLELQVKDREAQSFANAKCMFLEKNVDELTLYEAEPFWDKVVHRVMKTFFAGRVTLRYQSGYKGSRYPILEYIAANQLLFNIYHLIHHIY